jgi:phosphopantetheine adenylyltransferase
MHIGHKRYLEIAFTVAHWVYIHITTDEFANSLKPYTVKPCDIRRKQIEDVLDECGWRHRAEIRTLESNERLRCFCLNTDLSIAVVEPAYFEQFRELNRERRSKGLEEYCILVKPRTRIAGDLDISSRALNAADPSS